jgi:hypothetical protein
MSDKEKPIPAYEYPPECPECGARMPSILFVQPVARPAAKAMIVASIPLMAVWAVGFFLFSPVHVLAGGHWAAVLLTALLYLGPGVLLALGGMALPRTRRAKCRKCDYSILVEGPNMFRWR